MSNMSYCMFENTSNDIDQLIEAMEEAIHNGEVVEFLADMSSRERDAFDRMYSQVATLKDLIDEVSFIDLKAFRRTGER